MPEKKYHPAAVGCAIVLFSLPWAIGAVWIVAQFIEGVTQ